MVVMLLKMAPKSRAEVLPGVPKREKAVVGLTEKICILGKPPFRHEL